MRRKIIAGNWKMNKNATEASALAQELAVQIRMAPHEKLDTIIAPAFPFLLQCARNVNGVPGLSVAAQNCHWATNGAYTGEVSAAMIATTGAKYVIIGHSERRVQYAESNATLLNKIRAVLSEGLTPIFCVGESLDERNNHKQAVVVGEQLETTICQLSYKQEEKIIIAYEPVWAIGTGMTATPQQIQEMHCVIRNLISNKFGHAHGETISILYGGSCTPANAASIFACSDVDGALIGGASLKSNDFMAIRSSMVEILSPSFNPR